MPIVLVVTAAATISTVAAAVDSTNTAAAAAAAVAARKQSAFLVYFVDKRGRAIAHQLQQLALMQLDQSTRARRPLKHVLFCQVVGLRGEGRRR